MRSTAGAVALAFTLSGCAVEKWSFDTQRVTLDDADASARVESGLDVAVPTRCLSDRNCGDPAPRCDVQSGKCFGCLTDFDCFQSPSSPRCDMGTCVRCVDDSDCKVPGLPHCSPLTHNMCQECIANSDCPNGEAGTVPVCDVNQCFFSCADGGGACPPGQDKCNTLLPSPRCAQCLGDRDCAGAASGTHCDHGRCKEGLPYTGIDGGAPMDSGDVGAETSSDAAADSSSRADAADASD